MGKKKRERESHFNAKYDRVSWWLSGLKIWHCPCCGSGRCRGAGLIPALELLHATGVTKKKNVKVPDLKGLKWIFCTNTKR